MIKSLLTALSFALVAIIAAFQFIKDFPAEAQAFVLVAIIIVSTCLGIGTYKSKENTHG